MIYWAFFSHYLHDFVGQNLLFPKLEIGKNKSKRWAILVLHIVLYTLGMTLFMAPFLPADRLLVLAAINGGSHFVIDAITSRISSWAYAKQRYAIFWNTIGFDQFLHIAILYATLTVTM